MLVFALIAAHAVVFRKSVYAVPGTSESAGAKNKHEGIEQLQDVGLLLAGGILCADGFGTFRRISRWVRLTSFFGKAACKLVSQLGV